MKDRRVCQCVCVCECMRVCMRVAAEVRWGVENVRSSRSVKPVSGAGIFFFYFREKMPLTSLSIYIASNSSDSFRRTRQWSID